MPLWGHYLFVLSSRPILGNVISQECFQGTSSTSLQIFTRTQGWTDLILVLKGQDHCDLVNVISPEGLVEISNGARTFTWPFCSQRSRSRWPHTLCGCFSWTRYLKISSRERLQISYKCSLGLKEEVIRFCCDISGLPRREIHYTILFDSWMTWFGGQRHCDLSNTCSALWM